MRISENRKIRFQYFQWNVKKEMELRHDGAYYHISRGDFPGTLKIII